MDNHPSKSQQMRLKAAAVIPATRKCNVGEVIPPVPCDYCIENYNLRFPGTVPFTTFNCQSIGLQSSKPGGEISRSLQALLLENRKKDSKGGMKQFSWPACCGCCRCESCAARLPNAQSPTRRGQHPVGYDHEEVYHNNDFNGDEKNTNEERYVYHVSGAVKQNQRVLLCQNLPKFKLFLFPKVGYRFVAEDGGEEEFRMITAHWPESEVHLDMIEGYSVVMERCIIFDDNDGVSEKVCICDCRIEQGLESADFRRTMEQVFSYGCDEEVVDRADFLACIQNLVGAGRFLTSSSTVSGMDLLSCVHTASLERIQLADREVANVEAADEDDDTDGIS